MPRLSTVKVSVRSVSPVLVGCGTPLLHCLVVLFEEVVTLAILVLVTAAELGVKALIA